MSQTHPLQRKYKMTEVKVISGRKHYNDIFSRNYLYVKTKNV